MNSLRVRTGGPPVLPLRLPAPVHEQRSLCPKLFPVLHIVLLGIADGSITAANLDTGLFCLGWRKRVLGPDCLQDYSASVRELVEQGHLSTLRAALAKAEAESRVEWWAPMFIGLPRTIQAVTAGRFDRDDLDQGLYFLGIDRKTAMNPQGRAPELHEMLVAALTKAESEDRISFTETPGEFQLRALRARGEARHNRLLAAIGLPPLQGEPTAEERRSIGPGYVEIARRCPYIQVMAGGFELPPPPSAVEKAAKP